ASTRAGADNGSSGGSGGGGNKHPGVLPPNGDPRVKPFSTPKPGQQSPTPDNGKATNTPYPGAPSPTQPEVTTPTLPPAALTGTPTYTGNYTDTSPGPGISIVNFAQCANGKRPGSSTGCPDGWIFGILN